MKLGKDLMKIRSIVKFVELVKQLSLLEIGIYKKIDKWNSTYMIMVLERAVYILFWISGRS